MVARWQPPDDALRLRRKASRLQRLRLRQPRDEKRMVSPHGPVLRTLYGSLLRTARSIEALTNKHNAHFVGQVLRRSTIKQFAEASLVSLVSKPFSA